MAKTKIFVSYNHVDNRIAEAVCAALLDLSIDVGAPLDRREIEHGMAISPTIVDELETSDWYVMVYPATFGVAKDMNWAHMEAGTFFGMMKSRLKDVTESTKRVCFLYDADLPKVLAHWKGVPVKAPTVPTVSFPESIDGDPSYDATEVAQWLELILRTKGADGSPAADVTAPDVRRRIRQSAKKIIDAFSKGNPDTPVFEKILQMRMDLPVPSEKISQIHPETIVTAGDDKTFSDLFGISEANTTWATIRAQVSLAGGADPIWLSELERNLCLIADDKTPSQPEALHVVGVADSAAGNPLMQHRRFYRPIVTRYVKYRNTSKRCYVVFVPTREKRFSANENLSTLIPALVLAIRFRQRVMSLMPQLKPLKDGHNADKLALAILDVEREIIAIETEAQEFGLNATGAKSLESVFQGRPNSKFIAKAISTWGVDRPRLIDIARKARGPSEVSHEEALPVIFAILDRVAKINARFVATLATEITYVSRQAAKGD